MPRMAACPAGDNLSPTAALRIVADVKLERLGSERLEARY